MKPAAQSYPWIEVMNARDEGPVVLMVWHIRALYRATVRGEVGTRIEFTNGDTFDSAETVENVLLRLNEAVNGPMPGREP